MDRSEERAALAEVLLGRHRRAARVQPRVAPAVVRRHLPHVRQQRRCAGARRRVAGEACRILRQIVDDLLPRGARIDEGVKLRADARVVVERAEADRHLRAVGPAPAEDARAAHRAERLHGETLAALIRPDQLRAAAQLELLARDTRLRAHRRARVLPAARAMAMIGANEGLRDLEAHTPAETSAGEDPHRCLTLRSPSARRRDRS